MDQKALDDLTIEPIGGLHVRIVDLMDDLSQLVAGNGLRYLFSRHGHNY